MNRFNSIFKFLGLSLIIFILVASCQSSNSVVSNRLIQKRKYTSGWFVKNNKKQKGDKQTVEKESISFSHEESKRNSMEESINSGEVFSTNVAVPPIEENEVLFKPSNPLTNDQIVKHVPQDVPAINYKAEDNENKSMEVASPEEVERTNVAAIASYALMILGALFVVLGVVSIFQSQSYILLLVGVALLILSLIFALLAVGKYGHIEKGKYLAEFTLEKFKLAGMIGIICIVTIAIVWLIYELV